MLYYTGSNKFNETQLQQEKSLGGWISSSLVSNDVFNNLFSNVDYTTSKNKDNSIRVFAFKNSTISPINFSIHSVTPLNSKFEYKLGLVLNSIDENGCPYFEQLTSEKASPFYVTLVSAEGLSNKITLNNIPVNNYVGIFIQRIFKIETEIIDKQSCSFFETEFLSQNNLNNDTDYIKQDSIVNESIEFILSF